MHSPPRPAGSRRRVALMTAAALVAGGGSVLAAGPAAADPDIRIIIKIKPAPGAKAPRVRAIFPSDALTVRDPSQLTGRRVNLPVRDCGARPTDCDVNRLVNQLDGFDLDPRLAITFTRPVDPAVVATHTTLVKLRGPGPALRTGVERVVYDPTSNTVYAHPQTQLAPSTTYRLIVRPARGLPAASTTFTTLSATTGLQQIRQQLDSGAAFAAAGISAPGLQVDRVVPATGTAITYTADRGSATSTVTTPVANLSGTGAGSYVFGSFEAPNYLNADRFIPRTPTRTGAPAVLGKERLPFVLILPAGRAPAGGWPVAVFGHGFTGNASNVFLAATQNASRGLATLATDVVGHGFGNRSSWNVTTPVSATSTATATASATATVTLPAYGRGVDLDRNGLIENTEGVSTLSTPAPYAAIGSSDGLRQTTADLMTLVRAVGRGVDVDRDGTVDLRRTGVGYYGQSFGGIYGTILAGTDPQVQRLGLNVPGGPINEIVRLSPAFRPLLTATLGGARPSLLNGGAYGGFTESMPIKGDPPVTNPAPGALAIQDYLARSTWINRPGSPETYAPLIRTRPASTQSVIYQVAYGDQTVPNPTSYTLIDAGRLFDRTSLYRNDRSEQRTRNPHGFLLDPTFVPASQQAQRQIVDFLLTGALVDPDGPGDLWEVPISDPRVLLNLNFPNPLHP